jgi:hypothetical protein
MAVIKPIYYDASGDPREAATGDQLAISLGFGGAANSLTAGDGSVVTLGSNLSIAAGVISAAGGGSTPGAITVPTFGIISPNGSNIYALNNLYIPTGSNPNVIYLVTSISGADTPTNPSGIPLNTSAFGGSADITAISGQTVSNASIRRSPVDGKAYIWRLATNGTIVSTDLATDTNWIPIGYSTAQADLIADRQDLRKAYAPSAANTTTWVSTHKNFLPAFASVVASAATNTSVRLYKWVSDANQTIDAIALETVALLAASGYRLAIYRSSGGAPAGLPVATTAEMSGATASAMRVAGPATITGGSVLLTPATVSVTEGETLWIGLWTSAAATHSVRAVTIAAAAAYTVTANTFPPANSLSFANSAIRTIAGAYSAAGAFPDATASTVVATSLVFPFFLIRRSA